MSCSTLSQNIVRLQVSMGALPEGACFDNLQEYANAIATRLIVTPNEAFTSFATGSVAPTSNVGPWFKDCETWFIWDDATASYIPMTKEGFNNQQYFTTSGTFIVPDFIYKLRVHAWGGGGGGLYNATGNGQAGGGGGGYGRTIFSVTPGQSIGYTIGSGGSSGSPAGAGSSTIFLTMTAGGGAAGATNDAARGGVVTGADFPIEGGASGYSVAGQPSHGGASPQGGNGGEFSPTATARHIGIVPGGGGCGGLGATAGGVGAGGGILVEW